MISQRMLEIAVDVAKTLPPIDRIPYTADFDRAKAELEARLGRTCSAPEVWWSLVGARKRGLFEPRSRSRGARA